MKYVLSCLLIISGLQITNAESTDTLKEVRDKVVELHITRPPEEIPVKSKKGNFHIEKMPNGVICSGAVVSNSGAILTAKHCTENATNISVVFSDGKEYIAVIVAASIRHDLALVHVDRFNTPAFTLAPNLEQGETVLALGSPLGITGSLSQGIVAKRNGDEDFIDVTILPGNSGGPVFNTKGELVGISTAGFVVLMGFGHLNIMQSIDAIFGFAMELSRSR